MIPEIAPVNNYTGTDSATTFDFDFLITDYSELKVYHIDSSGNSTLLTKDIDYSIHEFTVDDSRVFPDFSNGGYIVFPLESSSYSILAHNEKISLQLDIPFSQESEYNNSSLLNLQALEDSLDYLTRLTQILKRNLERAPKFKEGFGTTDVDIPEPNANYVIGWNSEGTQLENIDVQGQINEYTSTITNAISAFEGLISSQVNTISTKANTALDNSATALENSEDALDLATKAMIAVGTYTHEQSIPAEVWYINHDLGKPLVHATLVDSAGTTFYPPVKYIDENNCEIHLIGATAGTAYLS